jgi:hypothetical protein
MDDILIFIYPFKIANEILTKTTWLLPQKGAKILSLKAK